MGLMETVEIRERTCGFPPLPQARGQRSPRAERMCAAGRHAQKRWVHPAPNPVFRYLRKAEAGGGKQDAIEDYSEPGPKVQIFCIREGGMGEDRRPVVSDHSGGGPRQQSRGLFQVRE